MGVLLKILLFGKNGQLGKTLVACLENKHRLIAYDRKQVDFCDLASLSNSIRAAQPDIIINAAAFTAVDLAETEPDLAYQVNCAAVKLIAQEANLLDAWLMHYSTDYVFNGTSNTDYIESDQPDPLNIYGASKLAGEQAIAMHTNKYIILRTTWLYSVHGINFATKILNPNPTSTTLRLITDRTGTPTSTQLVAQATCAVVASLTADATYAGVYHLTATGSTSCYGFASSLFAHAKQVGWQLPAVALAPILAVEYPSPAKRPQYAVLDISKFSRVFNYPIPHWEHAIADFFNDLRVYAS